MGGGVELADLFKITIGKNLDGNKIDRKHGSTPYITRKESTNGIDGFTTGHDEKFLWTEVPSITIGNETAKPFIQSHEFYTGTKVNILTPKRTFSLAVLKFLARCIESGKDRYSYSYTANSTRLAKQRIIVPLTSEGKLNINYMEAEIVRIENDFLVYIISHLQKRYDELVSHMLKRCTR